MARKDGIQAAKAVAQFLDALPATNPDLSAVAAKMSKLPDAVVTLEDLKKLEIAERAEAEKRGLPEFKFSTNEEMLHAIAAAAIATG